MNTTNIPSHYLNHAQELAKFLNRSSIITMIAIVGGFKYDEIMNEVAGKDDDALIAMLATQIQLMAKK